MDKIREKMRGFLAEFESPGDKEIQNFVSNIAREDASLDAEDFKKTLVNFIKQADEMRIYEKNLSSLDVGSPYYSDLEKVVKEIKTKQENLEDISNELKAAKKISKSIKRNRNSKKEKNERNERKLAKEENVTLEKSEEEPLKIKTSETLSEKTKSGEEGSGRPPEEEKEPENPEAARSHAQAEGMAEKPSQETKETDELKAAGAEAETGEKRAELPSEEKKAPENEEQSGAENTTEAITEQPSGNKAVKHGKKSKPKKAEEETSKELVRVEGAEGLMARLEKDDTKAIIKEKMSPEKQAVFELLEEKLMTDVETRINKLKDMQSKVLEEKTPQTLLDKIKTFFTKETALSIEKYDPELYGPLATFEGYESFKELERYWVNEPYAFVVILFNPDTNAYLYYVAEPVLSDFEDLFLREIKERLKDVLLVENIKEEGDKDKILTNKVKELVKDYAIEISPTTLEKVLYYTRRDFINFGKIDPLMHDNRIEDISANGHDIPIYLYHKKYTNIPTNIYYNENELNSYVIRLAQRCGKHISIAEPMVDATMPDGSRIQMTLGTEVTSHGCTFTIRKFSEIPITPVDLLNWNTFSPEEMAYLWLCIENNKSLIFAGGTASGKTSSLNAVSLFIPSQAKVVTLEDTRELKLPHPNWIPGVTRDSFTADGRGSIDMYELLRAALRQRPEYLLVGEVRGKEALTLFQAMSTGHTTFSTMHADSVSSAIHRLENPPISVPRTMIQALNIISIQSQTYVKGKRARRNMKLVEITDIDPTTRNIRTNDIFVWDPLTDKFLRVGESKNLNEIMIRRGWSLQDLRNELAYRQKILEFMVNNKISDFNAISTIIHDYQATPEKVIKKLNISG
ncbi:Type II/IV secretion system protein [uncultured archaeon]|nr:Type II/IV secretion system protein [uncultured archaeon]